MTRGGKALLLAVAVFSAPCAFAKVKYSEFNLVSFTDFLVSLSPNAVASDRNQVIHDARRMGLAGVVKSLGKIREIPAAKRNSCMRNSDGVFLKSFLDLFRREILIEDGGRQFWLPIQEPIVKDWLKKVPYRAEVVLLARYWGSCFSGSTQPLLLVVDFNPKGRPGYYQDLGEELLEAGSNDGAISAFDNCLLIDPKNLPALLNRARAKERKGDLEDSLIDVSSYLERKSQDSEALFLRGQIRARLGQAKEAVSDLDRVLAAKPQLAMGYFYRGMARRQLGQLDAAERDLSKARVSLPNYSGPYCEMAILRASQGNAEEARAIARKCTDSVYIERPEIKALQTKR